MHVIVQDRQLVGETEGTLFTLLQQGSVNALVTISNTGLNTLNYRFQEFDGSSWVDMDVEDTDLYNTLTAGQVRSFEIDSNYSQVKMVGDASGGAELDFAIQRYHTRSSGGPVPILSL